MRYELENMISSLSKTLEDVTYRLYRLEDSMATINAYIEEEKGEHIDAQFRWLQFKSKNGSCI